MVLPSRLSIILVMLALGFFTGLLSYVIGRYDGQEIILGQQAASLQKHATHIKKVTTEVVTVYKDRIKTVYVKGDTIIKKVPVYVTKENDDRCTINNGFVRLWNSANQVSVSGSPTRADAEASAVKLSDVAAQHSRESIICHATEQQLLSLQDWVRRVSKVH